jgi:DNA repair exonuclease SbcCD nuclease subunit
MIRPLRYRVISDLHLGHRQTLAAEIIRHLGPFFNHYRPRQDLDILFLAGDVFDRLLTYPMDEVVETTFWAAQLLRYCAANGIRLRVLKGTPSHDWEQSRLFETLAQALEVPVDLKYVRTLYIEYMEDLDFYVLYVPDEYHPDPAVTFKEVQALMARLGLSQVDIAVMHGQFNYQLPPGATRIPRHQEADYLGIVRHFISIGHVHTFSVYDRIIAQGSFDRTAHGEEGPKGGVECYIRPDGQDEYYFIENTEAKPYKTVPITSKTFERGLEALKKATAALPPDARVRIRAKKDNPVILAFDEVKKAFPFFVWSKVTAEDEGDHPPPTLLDPQLVSQAQYTPITITPENIKPLLLEGIQKKHSFTPRQMDLFNRLF